MQELQLVVTVQQSCSSLKQTCIMQLPYSSDDITACNSCSVAAAIHYNCCTSANTSMFFLVNCNSLLLWRAGLFFTANYVVIVGNMGNMGSACAPSGAVGEFLPRVAHPEKRAIVHPHPPGRRNGGVGWRLYSQRTPDNSIP